MFWQNRNILCTNKLQDLRKQKTTFLSRLLYMYTHLLITTTVCLHSQNPGTDQKQELKYVNSPLPSKAKCSTLGTAKRVSTFTLWAGSALTKSDSQTAWFGLLCTVVASTFASSFASLASATCGMTTTQNGTASSSHELGNKPFLPGTSRTISQYK